MSRLSSACSSGNRTAATTRRQFLGHSASIAFLPWLLEQPEGRVVSRPSFSSDPFSLGVASGDPEPDGFVLWTRLAPSPLEPGGGMKPDLVEVRWEVARDESMAQIVKSGTTVTTPALGHSAHVEVAGLESDRWYFFRFYAGDAKSPIGRTRTTPGAASTPSRLQFAFASCQHYEQGLFTAYEHMLKEDLDLVIHLGDYIYEGSGGHNTVVRSHLGPEIQSLDDYRIRYAQYRSDPHLRDMHARCPWLMTWDDHEVENDYADAIAEDPRVTPADFLERRANAYQAYYEMMPLRRRCLPRGPHLDLYRTVHFGQLAAFQILDTRQYRTDQPNGDRRSPLNKAALDPANTLLGATQWDWLRSRLIESTARWNVLAQQVMMGMVGYRASEAAGDLNYSMDQWPGYAHERMRVARFLQDRRVLNPIVLTGDIHSNWVNDLRVDDRNHDTPVIATEFVGTSISTGGNGYIKRASQDRLLADNPCIRFHNGQRGYVRCTVTPQAWKADFQVVENVTKPGAPVLTRASFVVESGQPGAKGA